VAFAPFLLNDNSDDKSLLFFSDKRFAEFDGHQTHEPSVAQDSQNKTAENVALMFAATASARFPFILPPYSIETSKNRWNFVDGAYADNSGADTALDLYRSLVPEAGALRQDPQKPANQRQSSQQLNGQSPTNWDIKVILLTSGDPLPDFSKINGTRFGDTVAPISAILSVRNGLSDQAVARICDFFKLTGDVDSNCENRDNARWKLKLVKIEDEAYALPLGWKISNTTFQVIQSLIGTHDECGGNASSVSDQDSQNNRCVLEAIEQTLSDFHK
jgi:hypothetical protein